MRCGPGAIRSQWRRHGGPTVREHELRISRTNERTNGLRAFVRVTEELCVLSDAVFVEVTCRWGQQAERARVGCESDHSVIFNFRVRANGRRNGVLLAGCFVSNLDARYLSDIHPAENKLGRLTRVTVHRTC